MVESILAHAVNEAVKENPNCNQSLESLVSATYNKFVEMKLDDFPRMCEVARVQNLIRLKEIEEHGNKGKYTESYGWSNDGTMKWEFDIPTDLYLFMKCLVYKDFWGKENEKVKRAFMNAVCRGDDAKELLIKTKMIYGSNKDVSLIT